MKPGNTYKKLHEDIFNCSLCNSGSIRVQRVQPQWDKNKKPKLFHKWAMIIGQAPGKTEYNKTIKAEHNKKTISKTPFSGSAGKNLEKWFETEAVNYQNIFQNSYKTSIIKCYPGKSGGGDRRPTKAEINNCRPFLKRQLDLIKPKIVIPIGKEACNWFLTFNKYEEVLGVLELFESFKIVCLPHPSPANNRFTKRKDIIKKIASSIQIIGKEWRDYEFDRA